MPSKDTTFSHLTKGFQIFDSYLLSVCAVWRSPGLGLQDRLELISDYAVSVTASYTMDICGPPPPQNVYVKILTSNVILLGGGVFERWLGQEGRVVLNGSVPLHERPQRALLPLPPG